MLLDQLRLLRGPNVWGQPPMLEAIVDPYPHRGFRPADHPALGQRLTAWLPRPDGQPRGDDAHLVLTLERLTLDLQRQVGCPVQVGAVWPTETPGVYRLAVECEEESLTRAALDTAIAMLTAALVDAPFDMPTALAQLRDRSHVIRFGPSTAAVVWAARRRGIPVKRLSAAGSFVRFGHGIRQRRIWTAETDQTSAIAETIAQDKQLTRNLLHAAGVPVPWGRPVEDVDDAVAALEELGPPVVVKPQFGNQGDGVATNLSTPEQVIAAYAAASRRRSHVMVETHITGEDYRLLVIGGQLVAAAHREPAHVIGNGQATVRELIAIANRDPRRSDDHATALSFIKLDAIALSVLQEQGLTPDDIPAAGQRVLIRRNANLSTGGTARDVTDQVHPEMAARAIEAARIVGLDIAGVDVVCDRIDRPMEEQRGAIVEVNAGPGLRMHLEPSAGTARPVGETIVDSLFPLGETGRIPLVVVHGASAGHIAEEIERLWSATGIVVGRAGTDGAFIAGRSLGPVSGARAVEAVLGHPDVAAAVVTVSASAFASEGLAFDRCDVVVLTEAADDSRALRRVLVECVPAEGWAVMPAGDPLTRVCLGQVATLDDGPPAVTAARCLGLNVSAPAS